MGTLWDVFTFAVYLINNNKLSVSLRTTVTHYSLDFTLQSCSQFSAEEYVGQLALAVAPHPFVVFIKVDVIKVYVSCIQFTFKSIITCEIQK